MRISLRRERLISVRLVILRTAFLADLVFAISWLLIELILASLASHISRLNSRDTPGPGTNTAAARNVHPERQGASRILVAAISVNAYADKCRNFWDCRQSFMFNGPGLTPT